MPGVKLVVGWPAFFGCAVSCRFCGHKEGAQLAKDARKFSFLGVLGELRTNLALLLEEALSGPGFNERTNHVR
jgi:hypothetical protein